MTFIAKWPFCEMGESDSCSLSDYMIQTGGDEDSWDEIIDADFSDDESKVLVQSPEDADLVLLSISLPPSPLTRRTVWEILADRLNGSAFEARFVDLKKRKANEAALKKRYEFDPRKRHTWTSRCGRHQVVGYFHLYVHGRIGLFTEEGFPVCVKLDELSAEDVRFVVNKLGQPLRGKVEAQLSAKQTITHVEYSNAGSNNRMAQELSTSTTEQESTKEGQDIPRFGCEGRQRGV